jgi:dienelactone hydrolase
VTYYSEGVKSEATLYLPPGFSSSSNAPAVILAPASDRGDTANHLAMVASTIAAKGVVAAAIDYRGWGRSGAFIYLADTVRWDDRLRFSQHTARVLLRRKRLVPEAQVIDIRNAITYIQGEPGVDPTRIGIYGEGLGGAHVVAIAANDARVKAGYTDHAWAAGKGVARRSFAPSAALQAIMVKLARTGRPPSSETAASAANEEERRVALAEYQPFRLLDQIPKDTAIHRFEISLPDGPKDATNPADFFVKSLGSR